MPVPVANQLANRVVARAPSLIGVENYLVGKIKGLYSALQRDLSAELARVNPSAPVRSVYRLNRLKQLDKVISSVIREHGGEVKAFMHKELKDLALVESNFIAKTINDVVNSDIISITTTPAMARYLASSTMIQGAPSAAWWNRQTGGMRLKFMDQMRVGVLRGEGLNDLVRRVRGTREASFRDGIMSTATRNAEALVRTSVQNVTNAARRDVYEANQDVIKALAWASTLDGKTTQICISLDGLAWEIADMKPIEHDITYPGDTAHWNCRSNQVPVLRSWDELSRSGKKGIKEIPPGTRASMNGQVPATLNYEQWLKMQPVQFQKEVLGPARWGMWQDGRIALKGMITSGARPISVAALRHNVGMPLPPVTPATEKVKYTSTFRKDLADIPTAEEMKAVGADMTSIEKDALQQYTDTDYGVLNRALRHEVSAEETMAFHGSDEKIVDWALRTSNRISQALESVPTMETVSFRGAQMTRTQGAAFLEEFAVGNEVTVPQFWSTTVSEGRALDFAELASSGPNNPSFLFRIRGKSGRWLDGHSEYAAEKEVLFDKNTSFRVLETREKVREGKKLTEIILEEIP